MIALLKSDRFGMEIWCKSNNKFDNRQLLKSDRFGMEIYLVSWDYLKNDIDVKIRPFRYGNF